MGCTYSNRGRKKRGSCTLSRLAPVPLKKWIKFLEFVGCHFKRRGKGDHIVWDRRDLKRPIIFQDDREVTVTVIKSNLRTLGMSAEQYLEILEKF
jgi:predicted RNA binding protein YcfA (HicA-like mRNA interferase family)